MNTKTFILTVLLAAISMTAIAESGWSNNGGTASFGDAYLDNGRSLQAGFSFDSNNGCEPSMLIVFKLKNGASMNGLDTTISVQIDSGKLYKTNNVRTKENNGFLFLGMPSDNAFAMEFMNGEKLHFNIGDAVYGGADLKGAKKVIIESLTICLDTINKYKPR